MLIGGKLTDAVAGGVRASESPATEEVVGLAAWGEEADAEAALTAAAGAAEAWRATPGTERAKALVELARRLRDNVDTLALLEARDVGNPIRTTRFDVESAAQYLNYFAGLVGELKGATIPIESGGWHFTVREPYGVVVRIVPFNHPLLFAGSKIAAPLAAGNTVILKPPPQAPLSSLELGRLAADLFPPGVLGIVTGEGPTVGRYLTSDPRVSRVAFTGSVGSGKAIVAAAGEHLPEVSLELGGKNPMIVFPDAQPALVAEAVVRAMNFAWQGQSCGSASRLFLHDSLYEEVVKDVVARLNALKLGPPEDPETEMGPVVSRAQYDKVLSYIERGRAEGAAVLAGGAAVTGPGFDKGFWVQPTVFGDVDEGMAIARDEIFGPVLSVFRWTEESEVIRLANDTTFGLTANVWTNDIGTALRVVPQLRAGYCYVNGRTEHFLGLPFGGYRQSGWGREEALDELLSYTQLKSVSLLPPR
ncbi:MAG: aldehyde dehydrogenase [Blastococcus sp.]|jgi:betaine-aldehyde dehydrogenase|nr:aldehyde dehydrogenase [Blastococcus sp.]